MTTCPACGGDGECKNEYHTRGITQSLLEAAADILLGCSECGSVNTQMGDDCTTCGGSGEVND